MPLSMTVTNHWDDGKRLHVVGTIQASGVYPTGGDVFPRATEVKTNNPPFFFTLNFLDTVFSTLYIPQLSGSKLKFYDLTTGAELINALYPAGLTVANAVAFYAIYPKRG